MKAINDTELQTLKDKLDSIKHIATTWHDDSPELIVKIIMSSILEVINE